ENIGADAVLRAVALARNLLLLRQDGVDVGAKLDDEVLALEAGDDAGDDLFLAILELVEDDFAFRVTKALHEVLFGRLCRYAPVACRIEDELLEELVVDLRLGVEICSRLLEGLLGERVVHDRYDLPDLENFELSNLGVVLDLNIELHPEKLAGSRPHRVLDRFHHQLFADPLLLAHLLDDAFHLGMHHRTSSARCRTEPRDGDDASYLICSFKERESIVAHRGTARLPKSA